MPSLNSDRTGLPFVKELRAIAKTLNGTYQNFYAACGD
jgi:hypothetical protein